MLSGNVLAEHVLPENVVPKTLLPETLLPETPLSSVMLSDFRAEPKSGMRLVSSVPPTLPCPARVPRRSRQICRVGVPSVDCD